MKSFLRTLACACFVSGCLIRLATAADPTPIDLWPAKAPGEVRELPPEQDVNKPTDKLIGDRKIIKLANVSTPQITVFEPPANLRTGCALIIAPGGGHSILAYDHEGTECAQYFAARGVTAIVLKYRVPARNPDKRWEAAVQDAQRGVSLVRSRAKDWKLDPQRIGILGFSAGGETAGLTAILHEQRQYQPVDKIDEVSCRPDFAALIYAGGFENKKNPWTLQDHVKVDSTTPPMFLIHAQDDGVSVANSVLLFSELKKAKIPAELHVYASGGHGYGMRQTGHPVNQWPDRCAEWLINQGFNTPTK
ncbi:Acetylxylan esterase precursor [Anatilimnocola aggregata]|uniref:Acetylxylan esterase n=1 Tax=Anatilimnocola aggregata TaxID=2528021 RepID=A0A517YAL0_9BACT|nr:alpha/beta hydrolase [Anatilimnocola aggregata]QDU27276.1 Acetylxylan esterase precursor [Anatilimnocola aggregata]